MNFNAAYAKDRRRRFYRPVSRILKNRLRLTRPEWYVFTIREDGKRVGLDRMLDALNEKAGAAPEEILHGVRQAVSAFVKDAEQFDDITMLCMEYKGK